jgi:hydrogenase nickel incorporation protein HypA/HybF
MHETSIAWEILETARRAAAGAELERVCVRLGGMSGVVEEALRFAFDALKPQAGAADAELVIERVAVEVLCPACGCRSRPEGDLVLWCPRCGAPMRVTSGEQLELAWVETAGEPPDATGGASGSGAADAKRA